MRVPWAGGGDALRFDIVSCVQMFDAGRVLESGVGAISHVKHCT